MVLSIGWILFRSLFQFPDPTAVSGGRINRLLMVVSTFEHDSRMHRACADHQRCNLIEIEVR